MAGKAQKLLYVRSGANNCIEECLLVVPDDYNRKEVLAQVREAEVVQEPYIAQEIELEERTEVAEYREFYG